MRLAAVGVASLGTITAVAVLHTDVRLQDSVQLPFPDWLHDFTGLTEWPGLEPPYIPLDFIDFSKLPPASEAPMHPLGQCGGVPRGSCSFDCYNCVTPDDVYTCPVLSQTFDDGPSPFTLHLLNNLGSKLTFFTIGVNIVRFPDIYVRTQTNGHVMGSHTWLHKFLPGLSNEEVVAQIEWSIWAMNATGGHLPKWFRPPYGGIDNRIRAILRQFGMQAVMWDFDTFDWKLVGSSGRAEADVVSELDRFRKASHGRGLILEHDSLSETVNLGVKLSQKLPNQWTVPQCVGGIDYMKVFNKRPKTTIT